MNSKRASLKKKGNLWSMKKKVSIVGGGTAGLFLAAFLDAGVYEVTIFEKKSSFGRKFLVAGDGGFNLTHSEDMERFKLRYTPSSFLEEALNQFSNDDLRAWLEIIGIPTFAGSSGRVFPEKGIKPIEVLKAIETFLVEKNVNFQFNSTFTGWGEKKELLFDSKENVVSDVVVFALGGSSWKVTGSDGSWQSIFEQKGIATLPFRPANCAYEIDWQEDFIRKYEGLPLKNIAFRIEDQMQKGEAVITKLGIEGNAIYGLSPKIQSKLDSDNFAEVFADFKPTLTEEMILQKLKSSKKNRSVTLRESLKLNAVIIDLIKLTLTKEEFMDVHVLAGFIKKFPLKIIGSAPIDEAISTSGGIDLKAINDQFELNQIPNQYCIGEMLDWNAPTGGYLIQACASMGVFLAKGLNETN